MKYFNFECQFCSGADFLIFLFMVIISIIFKSPFFEYLLTKQSAEVLVWDSPPTRLGPSIVARALK